MKLAESSVSGSRKRRDMKIRDPLFIAAMIAMSGVGVVVAINEGGSARETLVFVIFAMTMLYMVARW